MTQQPTETRYLMPAEAADLLHVSAKTLSRWALEGRVPFVRTLGGHRRYDEEQLRQLIADNDAAWERADQ